MYLMVKEIASKRMALFAALFLAFCPWHVHFSRVGFQLISTIFWLLCSLFLIYKSMKKPHWYPLAATSIIVTFFTYSTIKLYFIPLIILFVFSYKNEMQSLLKSQTFWLTNLVGWALVLVLIGPYLSQGTFFSRWNQVQEAYVSTPQNAIGSYVKHFSPDFLFLKGDADSHGQYLKRHSIHGLGELYLIQLPLILLGIWYVFKRGRGQRLKFFFWFVLIYPLGTVFTALIPQATRSVIGVIPFQVLTAAGIEQFLEIIQKEKHGIKYAWIAGVLCIASFAYGVFALYNNPHYSSSYWGFQYGFREVYQSFEAEQLSYDDLLITHRFNMGHILLQFYNLERPCKKCGLISNPIEISLKKKQLFALRPDDINEARKTYPELEFRIQRRIRGPNGKIEIFIGKFSQARSF